MCMFVLLNKEIPTVRSKYVLMLNLNLISVDFKVIESDFWNLWVSNFHIKWQLCYFVMN